MKAVRIRRTVMAPLSRYNREHQETLQAVQYHLRCMSGEERADLERRIAPYLKFRQEVAAFQDTHFREVCTLKCFQDRTSACCGREGIAAFFADVVVNALLASEGEIEAMIKALDRDQGGPQCVYLRENGCLWHLKPVVCEMFLCDHAARTVLGADEELTMKWEELRERERLFTWPDRPVLFDDLESIFLERGCDSPLMYCHKSPGLLRVKAGFLNLQNPF